MAIIKADAYGHGALITAQTLQSQVSAFAVAITEEAVTLRQHGISAPIVVLEGPHEPQDCDLAGQHQLTLVAHSEAQLKWLDAARQPVDLWLKVDTGMHRLGLDVESVPALVQQYKHLLNERSVMVTHMACADELDNPFTIQQTERIEQLAKAVGLPLSVANSPAMMHWPSTHAQWNRLGIALYGANPVYPQPAGIVLHAAMTLQASIIAVHHVPKGEGVGYGQTWNATRDSRIATVGIGYGDGYPRHCPNGTPVLVHGQRATLAGRVSMDMLCIDVTDIGQAKVGDRVELWGANLAIDEIAQYAQTIAYELMTRVSARVPRVIDSAAVN